jgi:proteasome lid subunit RPN8/RPN11
VLLVQPLAVIPAWLMMPAPCGMRAPLYALRPEMVVGWYHSHPGFGCWLSGVDINTQQSFEALNARAVAVVVDPVQSVKVRMRPLQASVDGLQWV